MTASAGGRGKAGGRGRLVALVVLAVAIAGGGVLATVTARRPPRTTLQPAALAAEVAPAGSASSSWYCPGAPGPAADAGTTDLLLTNAAGRAVRVGVVVVDSLGAQRQDTLELGPHAEASLAPGQIVAGAWLAARVEVAGGAVSATELVDGRIVRTGRRGPARSTGRTVASCASEVSPRWYFASGSTREGSTLRVALFNPTPNLAVVDLSFVTSSGFTAPAPFQGLVVEPWTLRTLTVGAYVQNQGSIATMVTSRSGAVVASEFQLYGPAGDAGVSLALGAPATSTRWDLPGVQDESGGASALVVFNPSAQSVRVGVDVRLPSGPVAPFTQVLGPRSVWTLPTGEELRIAPEEHYALQVRTTEPGVVIARVGSGSPRGPAPWWAQDVTVTGLETSAAHTWVVANLPVAPSPVSSAAPDARPRATSALTFQNPGRRTLRVKVVSWAGARRNVEVVEVPALEATTVVAPSGPVFVRADGPVAVMGDASPAGMAGVVGVPAVPVR